MPIGAVQTASGYDVAWKLTGANEYTVWNTDSNGNYVSSAIGVVSGTSTALESFGAHFRPGPERRWGDRTSHDGDRDRWIDQPDRGWEPYIFFITAAGRAQTLKYDGADVVAGQYGDWVPIGAVQTASGYDVAWKLAGRRRVYGLEH